MDFSPIEDTVSLAALVAGAKGNGALDTSLHCGPRCDPTSMVNLDRHRLEIRRQKLAAGAA